MQVGRNGTFKRLWLLALSSFVYASFAVANAQELRNPQDQTFIYERSEDPWASSWGKTYLMEAKVKKIEIGHILHAAGNKTQIFDPKTLAMTEAVDIQFDLKIDSDKKSDGFAKGESWTVAFDRPNNTSTSCAGTALHHEGKITSDGENEEEIQINGVQRKVKVISAIWQGYWRSCYSGSFTRKIKYSPDLQALILVDYVYYYNNSVSGGYKLVLKEIKSK